MLKSVTIHNYRGIKNAEIKELDRINIFIGRNGVGKSAILEAVYLIKAIINNLTLVPERGEGRPASILGHLIQRRGSRGSSALYTLWHKYEVDKNIIINLEWLSKRNSKIIFKYKSPAIILADIYNDSEKITDIEVTVSGSAHPRNINSKILTEEDYIYLRDLCLIDDILTKALPQIEMKDFKLLKHTWKDEELRDILNKVYKTDYKSIELMPDMEDEFRITFLDSYIKMRVDYDDLPDGIKCGFAYIIRAMRVEGSALLIEEIENHQHPGSVEKLLEALFEIAVQKNVQLFFTTHSMEVFNDAVDLASKYPVKLFHVTQMQPGEVSVRELKKTDAQLLKSMEVDIVKLEDAIDEMV